MSKLRNELKQSTEDIRRPEKRFDAVNKVENTENMIQNIGLASYEIGFRTTYYYNYM